MKKTINKPIRHTAPPVGGSMWTCESQMHDGTFSTGLTSGCFSNTLNYRNAPTGPAFIGPGLLTVRTRSRITAAPVELDLSCSDPKCSHKSPLSQIIMKVCQSVGVKVQTDPLHFSRSLEEPVLGSGPLAPRQLCK